MKVQPSDWLVTKRTDCSNSQMHSFSVERVRLLIEEVIISNIIAVLKHFQRYAGEFDPSYLWQSTARLLSKDLKQSGHSKSLRLVQPKWFVLMCTVQVFLCLNFLSHTGQATDRSYDGEVEERIQ